MFMNRTGTVNRRLPLKRILSLDRQPSWRTNIWGFAFFLQWSRIESRRRRRRRERRISFLLLIRKNNALQGIPHRSSLGPAKNEKFHEGSIAIFHSTSLSWHRWFPIAFNGERMRLHPSFRVRGGELTEKDYFTWFQLTLKKLNNFINTPKRKRKTLCQTSKARVIDFFHQRIGIRASTKNWEITVETSEVKNECLACKALRGFFYLIRITGWL